MIIKKHIEIAMNIQDCIGLYTDIDNNLKNMIISRYKGRCLRQSYIIDILDIVKYSDCVINQEGLPDFGVMNVIFEAMVLVYTPGEIINGCRVVSREGAGTIICLAPNTDIVLSHNPILNSIQTEQIISVRVHKVKYTIGNTKISVSAIPLLPSKTPTLYEYIPKELPKDFADYVSNITNNIKAVLADSEQLPKKNYEFFKLLLHAYKDEQKAQGDIYIDLLKLVENPPVNKCYIGRDPRVFPTSSMIYISSNIEAIGRDDVRIIYDLEPVQILATLLDDYHNNIRTIFEMVKIYDTQTLMDSHRNLWMIYGALKNTK